MQRRGLVALLLASLTASLAVLGVDAAIAAPAQLYGKSVVVAWSESRVQKASFEGTTHSVARNGELKVYISSAGRVFNRLTYSGFGMGAGGRPNFLKLKSGSSDQINGEGPGQARIIGFSGNTMTSTTPMEGGARRVLVTFDSNFSGCSAQVLTGKAGGVPQVGARSGMNGNMPIEIISVETGAATCKVQSGNVFGN